MKNINITLTVALSLLLIISACYNNSNSKDSTINNKQVKIDTLRDEDEFLPPDSVNGYYNYTKFSSLSTKYMFEGFELEGNFIKAGIALPNAAKSDTEVLAMIMIQTETQRNLPVDMGLTLKEFIAKATINFTEYNNINYPYCSFKKENNPSRTNIIALCDDNINIITIASQSKNENKAVSLMKEVLDVMSKK